MRFKYAKDYNKKKQILKIKINREETKRVIIFPFLYSNGILLLTTYLTVYVYYLRFCLSRIWIS
jgi:hypothetical protein